MSAAREQRRSLLGRVVRAVVWCAGVGAFGVLAWLFVSGVSARTAPGPLETSVARTARHWAVPRAARALTNPEPQSPENLRDGLAHFADHCASCHANDGSGDTPVGRGLYPRAPDMRLPATQDLSDGELFYLIEEGIKLTGMPAWGTGTPDGERASWHLVQFIRALPRLTPAQLDEMRDLNPRSPAEFREEEDMRRFLAGEAPPSAIVHVAPWFDWSTPMTRFAFVRSALLFAVVALLGMPVFAHEGHAHKIMGTVAMLHEQHLEVKDKDGKAHVMTLNASTKIMKGKTAIKASDIKAGDRVVATVMTEKDVMIAKEVQVGVNADSKAVGDVR